jgi:hypothetical protein
MTELEIDRLIADILMAVIIGAFVFVFARAFWLAWRNRGKGTRWVRHDDCDQRVNTNGIPMINESFDAMGNTYGSTDHHH